MLGRAELLLTPALLQVTQQKRESQEHVARILELEDLVVRLRREIGHG